MWTIVYMSIIAFFVLLSAKRGCIIISFLIILFYTPKWLKDRRNRKISIILIALLAIMVVMGIRYFSEYDYLTERLELMTEGYASSRDLIAEDIINYCFHTHFSFINLLFGYGFNYSWCMAGQSAHNDWLELLASHGIMGIVVYAFFFINMFKECWRIKAYDLKQMSYLCIIVWFLSSLFSQGYGGASFVALMLGFVLGRSLYENNNLNNNKVIRINNKHNQTVSYVN